MRFKVGDFVRIRANADVESVGIRGDVDKTIIWKVTDANVSGGRNWYMIETSYDWWSIPDEMLEPVNEEKIVITSNGVETTARLYDGKNVVKKSIAKCCKEDKFDFMTGAEIAFERLKEHKYYSGKVVCTKASANSCFTVGKIYKFVNGACVTNEESIKGLFERIKPVKSLEDLNATFYETKFIELVEE